MKMKAFFILIFAACLLVSGCQRSTISTPTPPIPPEEMELPAETTAKIADAETSLSDAVQVVSNEGNLEFETLFLTLQDGVELCREWEFDEFHHLYLIGRPERDADNNVVAYLDTKLLLMDSADGIFVAECSIEEGLSHSLPTLHYYDDGCVLFSYSREETGNPVIHYAYDIRYAYGELTAQPIQFEEDSCHTKRIVSPDGRYIAYVTADLHSGYGGIDIQSPDGTVTRILSDVSDGKGIQAVTVYNSIAFSDNTTLLYTMGGWEWSKGYGFYDVETGENRVYPAEKDRIEGLYGYGDGYLYGYASVGYLTSKIWQISQTGEKVLIASMEKSDDVFLLPDKEGLVSLWFQNGYWFCYDETAGQTVLEEQGNEKFQEMRKNGTLRTAVTIYSADFRETLAELSVEYDAAKSRFLTADKLFTLVIPWKS